MNNRLLKLKYLRFKRRSYQIGLILLGVLAAIIIAFNFWFIDHAEEALAEIVSTQSNGKLKLKLEKFKFNWIKNKIQLENAVLYSTDTTAPSMYQFNVKNIKIKAIGFLPLLFDNELLIDSIHLFSPHVVVTKVNINKRKQARVAKQDTTMAKFSIAEEMGKISKSINDAISILKIGRLLIDDGSFSIIDKTKQTADGFAVNRIKIRMENLRVDSVTRRKKRKKILFTDEIFIQTTNQNLTFPGKRHSLSFKNFKITLKDKRITIDSCTFSANKGDSSKTAFSVFFDKLNLTNINFDTLYLEEVIKGDSLYCVNPKIKFDIEAKPALKKDRLTAEERIDNILQKMLGDIILNHVIVNNAAISINAIKNGKTNTYSTTNSNFELQNLIVKQSTTQPIYVGNLMMTIRDFNNQVQDGRYKIAFDSVKFFNSTIRLSNFSFIEFDKKRNITKTMIMPYFHLIGMSWESLLYSNKLQAESVTFWEPNINYTIQPKNKTKPKTIFETLGSLSRMISLNDFVVKNGAINLELGEGANLKLDKVNLSILPNELTASKKLKNIQHAVKELNFEKAVFKKNTTIATLTNVKLNENKNGLHSTKVDFKSNGINAEANNIKIDVILLDSTNHSITIDGIMWQSAKVHLFDVRKSNRSSIQNNPTTIALQHIQGSNTSLLVEKKGSYISGFLNSITANKFITQLGKKPTIDGLIISGKDFLMLNKDVRLSVASLNITDNSNSTFNNIQLKKVNEIDSIIAYIPKLIVVPDISQIINGTMFFDNIVLFDPTIIAKLGKKDNSKQLSNKPLNLFIASAVMHRPKVNLTLITKNNLPSFINWDGVKANSTVNLTNFYSTINTPIKADKLGIYLTNFEYINTKGRRTATNDNKLNLELQQLLVRKNDANKIEWITTASILSLDQLFFDSLGKNRSVLTLNRGSIKNINLNSNYINHVGDIIKNSTNLLMSGTDGSFSAVKNNIRWNNFQFRNGFFSLDSFSLSPKQSIEDYRIKKAFNEDYLAFKTGKISGGAFDMYKYGNDSILSIEAIQIDNTDLITFKDKRQPDTSTKHKLLPVHQILNIPTKIDIDKVTIKDMNVQYWEINPNTDTLGIVPVTNLNATISPIKNYDLSDDDSLTIIATANVIHQLPTKLFVRESYTDSLGGFLMQLKTGPMDLVHFTNILKPLAAIAVTKGKLDSLSLMATANEHISSGYMRMYYKSLWLKLLNKKDLEKQTFLNKIITWAANALIIRHNNKGKKSIVFFERLKDKSAINFIIKTSLSGIKSSIGVPGNKRKLRQYEKKLERARKLPLKTIH